MSFATVAFLLLFFYAGFQILRWVQRKTREITLPKVAEGQWDPIVANYSFSTENKHRDAYEEANQKNAEDRKLLGQLLVRRAMHDIDQVMTMTEQKSTLQQLVRMGSIGEDVWLQFQATEEFLHQEMQQVAQEAERIKPGWSDSIFQQAQQLLVVEKRRQAEQDMRRLEQEARTRQGEQEQAAQEELRRQEEVAQRNAQELLQMEEKSAASSSGKSAGRKKSK